MISADPSVFARRTEARARSGVSRKAVEIGVGRLPLVPPASLRREDRRRREDFRDVRPPLRRRGEFRRRRHVLRHQASGRDAPAEHLLQVGVRLRVDVRVHEPRDDPFARDVLDPGSGRQGRQRLRSRSTNGDDPLRGDHDQGIRHGRRPGPVNERGAAQDERGREQENAHPLRACPARRQPVQHFATAPSFSRSSSGTSTG